MKFLVVCLACLTVLLTTVFAEQSVTLAWDPNPETDIGGYIVYYGSASRNYTNAVNVGNVTTNTVRGLVDGATYFFAVTAYNTNGLESDFSDEVSYSSAGGNLPPLVNAGPDLTVTLPATASLHGTATDDGNPNPPAAIATTWSKFSGPGTVTFANAAKTNTTASFSAAGPYVLRLTASDGALSANDTVTIVVTSTDAPNTAPVVNAGPDQTNTWPAGATLTGAATDDGKPGSPSTLTTTWTRFSGPGMVTFADATKTNTTVSFSATGTYVLRLTASDGALFTSDDVTIVSTEFVLTVVPVNQPPTISDIPTVVTPEDQPVAIPFIVGDRETPASALTVEAFSFNEALASAAEIELSGGGSNRTATVHPQPGQSGETLLMLVVTDSHGAIAWVEFSLIVNRPPVLGEIPPQQTLEDLPAMVRFTAHDAETLASALRYQAISLDQELVRNADIQLGGIGSERVAVIRPRPGRSGATTLLITVTDAHGASATAEFSLTVQPVNSPPSITAILPQVTRENVAVVVNFVVTDPETPPAALTLSVTSSNEGLVPIAAIQLGGTHSNRTAIIHPQKGQWGVTTLRITVTDPAGAGAFSEFSLTVTPLNQPPSISAIPAQATSEGALTVQYFTVNDLDTPLNSLTVKAKSSNQALVPDANIFLSGVRGNRAVGVWPVAQRLGQATITVTVSDGVHSSDSAFALTVRAPLHIERIGTNAVLRWAAENARLQQADSVAGPWHDLQPAPNSPFPATLRGTRVYRLREE